MMLHYLEKQFFLNSILQWLIALLCIVGGVFIAKLLYWLFKKTSKKLVVNSKTLLDDILIDTLEKPAVLALALFGFYIGTNQLNMSANLQLLLTNTNKVLIAVCITWFVSRLVNAILTEYMLPAIEASQSTSKKQLLPILTKLITIAIWSIGIIIAFNSIGYNLAGLIAGLGIGGLAFALAAKDYIQNIFGGVSVFTDKPFSINDRIKVDGFDGVVEEIGIRSSRIRTLSGSLVTIPNSKFISSSVENVALEPNRKVTLRLGLTYDTNIDKMQEAMSILKSIVQNNQALVTETPIVFFENFTDSSLCILFIYYIRKGADIPTAQSVINLDILKHFNQAGLEFAFPTQTIYTIKQ